MYYTLYNLSAASINKEKKLWDTSLDRWTRLVNYSDSKVIWKAINWKGSIESSLKHNPSEKEFQKHFDGLLNPSNQPLFTDVPIYECPYIPILDDPINAGEIQKCINDMKANKPCDANGISPGIYKYLPITWIVAFTFLLNVVFNLTFIPVTWIYSKLIVLFKGGSRSECGNFRGISINDTILYNRLAIWYRTSKEQAGCQINRGCIEHIFTVRLICEYAKKTRNNLFVLYIDFEKANDKVPKQSLVNELKRLGCGKKFLAVLLTIYSDIKQVFKSAVISTSIGVRQGAAISCMLSIIYLDIMVRMINQIEDDSYLGSLHAL